MKDYIVIITRIQKTNMVVRAQSNKNTIEKVNMVLCDCEKKGVSLDQTFNQGSFFKYRVKKKEK